MKKKFYLFFCLFLICLFLVGCNNSSSNKQLVNNKKGIEYPQVLMNESEIRISAESYEEDTYVDRIILNFENKLGKEILIKCKSVIINDYIIDFYMDIALWYQ